jgi:hypothetical protein
MNFIPNDATIWVLGDKSEYMHEDYIPMTLKMNIIGYTIYVILWLASLKLLKMFDNEYDRVSIAAAFFIGCFLLMALDKINDLNWEISINKNTFKYTIMNNKHLAGTPPNVVIPSDNKVYNFKNNTDLLLIDSKKFLLNQKKGGFKDLSLVEWRKREFSKHKSSTQNDITSTSENITAQIGLLMKCAYYVFTILITLSAVAYRINKKLFYRIIPLVLSSAIVGLGSMFILLWEHNYTQLLMHLAFKKKLLITSISFALAAIFIFFNNL